MFAVRRVVHFFVRLTLRRRQSSARLGSRKFACVYECFLFKEDPIGHFFENNDYAYENRKFKTRIIRILSVREKKFMRISFGVKSTFLYESFLKKKKKNYEFDNDERDRTSGMSVP